METVVQDAQSEEPRSTIACHICRKRKVKCGRELPECSICRDTSRECSYPKAAQKPGPKIGSSQSRKRKQGHDHNDSSPTPNRKASLSLAAEDERISARKSPERESSSDPLETSENGDKGILGLSFIIHPSHEPSSPEEPKTQTPGTDFLPSEGSFLASTCFTLGVEPDFLGKLLKQFFENFTSFQLFRESLFRSKLHHVTSAAQLNALVAAMLAFAVKERDFNIAQSRYQNALPPSEPLSAAYFSDLAITFVNQAIKESGDDPPPLVVLQALILATHWLLIQGVRGRAWRYIGTCVRIAYELNLHVIDSGKAPSEVISDPERWAEDEERRRAWWAIWEMDVFASTIRRCPIAIDSSQNETWLPAQEENWTQSRPHVSCFLEMDLTARWKSLQTCGNQSPKAWFIVINSMMKEAQTISSPMAVNATSSGSETKTKQERAKLDEVHTQRRKEASSRLSTLRNSLRCLLLSLPSALRYKHQYLSFNNQRHSGDSSLSPRQMHSSIYSIHVMAQLTKLMIHKYHIFRSSVPWPWLSSHPEERDKFGASFKIPHPQQSSSLSTSQSTTLEQYFEAADEILAVVNGSSENHFRYVNPFLGNTIWLGAAVQLLHREIKPIGSDKELKSSNFEVLTLTYSQYADYWNISAAPQRNLETLQTELAKLKASRDSHGKAKGSFTQESASRRSGGSSGGTQVSPESSDQVYRSTQVANSDIDSRLNNKDQTAITAPLSDHLDYPTPTTIDSTSQRAFSVPTASQQNQSLLMPSFQPSILPSASIVLDPSSNPLNPQNYQQFAPDQMQGTPTQFDPTSFSTSAPDFLDLFSMNQDVMRGGSSSGFGNDFSNYLDEMLSGSYMA